MKDMIDEDVLEVIKGADSIVVNFPVPEDTQFISWAKFNRYMIDWVKKIERYYDIINDNKESLYVFEECSDSNKYTSLDIQELRVGDNVVFRKDEQGFIGVVRNFGFQLLINNMINPTGKVVIIPSDNGNEYKFYTSEDKYYHVKPSV